MTGRIGRPIWPALLILLSGVAHGVAQPTRPAPADVRSSNAGTVTTAPITDAEQTLWAEIRTLQQPLPTTQPYAAWFTQTRARRQDLLERTQLYLTLYPGGGARDEAVRIELATMFELGSLAGGDLSALCARVAELRRAPASDAIEAEAAYWQMLCDRRALVTAISTQPASSGNDASLAHLTRAIRQQLTDYVRRFPESPHTLRLLALLFEDARRRDDRSTMQWVIEHAGTAFPAASQTHALLGTWNRLEAVGEPFVAEFELADDQVIRTRSLVGRPLLIVVWAGHDAAACTCVRDVEAFRRQHPEVRVVGVNLDATTGAMAAACRRLEIGWPQFNDGLGWGNAFVRTWGLRDLPWVFVIDQAGKLRGTTQGPEWQTWLTEMAGGETPVPPPTQD